MPLLSAPLLQKYINVFLMKIFHQCPRNNGETRQLEHAYFHTQWERASTLCKIIFELYTIKNTRMCKRLVPVLDYTCNEQW